MSSPSAEMNTPTKSKREFEKLCLRAVNCPDCFNNKKLNIQKPKFDVAQPRWIGSSYWTAKTRILVVMINPGSGVLRKDSTDERVANLLHQFAKSHDRKKLAGALELQRDDMRNWGDKKFLKFYRDMGLDAEISQNENFHKDKIAFANIAWCAAKCATKNNTYPAEMLNYCFETHTAKLVEILAPNIVILSGSATHKFEPKIRDVLPSSKIEIIKTFHFAHREGEKVEKEKQKLVEKQLRSAKLKLKNHS